MVAPLSTRVVRVIVGPVLAATMIAMVSVAAMGAQGPNRTSNPVDLPDGPAKAGFDISRFSNGGNGWFETFYVKDTLSLRDALHASKVAEDTRLLVTDTVDGKLALVTDQMAFHHIAQGSAGGKDWLVSF